MYKNCVYCQFSVSIRNDFCKSELQHNRGGKIYYSFYLSEIYDIYIGSSIFKMDLERNVKLFKRYQCDVVKCGNKRNSQHRNTCESDSIQICVLKAHDIFNFIGLVVRSDGCFAVMKWIQFWACISYGEDKVIFWDCRAKLNSKGITKYQ